MSDIKLSLSYYHKDPVEINVFSEALLGLGSAYERFLLKNIKEGEKIDAQSRLYINQIRSGSILIDLVDLFPLALAFAEGSNSIIEFTKHLNNLYKAFKSGDHVEELQNFDKGDIKDFVKFIEPVAKDRSAQYNIGAFNIQGDVILNFGIDTQDGYQIQAIAQNFLATKNLPSHEIHSKVMFYWYQARSDSSKNKQAGYSGKIDSISSKQLKVIFENDDIKEKMLGMDENPFKKAFVVDVLVESVQENPFAYKVIKIHEIFDL
jgi:hypothetical protein